ncbi:MAG: hypothetical protein JWQ43_3106 [Glaciihabitans sp.]|nr:hypothetical protein [Glaciihabitans sp.]
MSEKQPKEPDRLSELRQDTERTRGELEATLGEVANRLNPRRIAGEATSTVKDAAASVKDGATSVMHGATDWVNKTLHRDGK